MIEVEKRLAQSEQYSRRECVEISGFPTSIPEDKVEEKFVEVLKEVGVNVTPRDLHAVHRLKKKSVVIAKFVNRKDAISALQKR